VFDGTALERTDGIGPGSELASAVWRRFHGRSLREDGRHRAERAITAVRATALVAGGGAERGRKCEHEEQQDEVRREAPGACHGVILAVG
jgi:hypothetical protein